jgi:hypothetical protein
MVSITRREMLGSLLVALGGCAAFAVRPPTPAKDIPPGTMDEPEPGIRFFATVFGSQSVPKIPKKTHTWATVIKATDASCPADFRILEHHTISWLPVSGVIRVWHLHVEPGRNYGLRETILFGLQLDERISQWGPYEIHPRGFRRFLVQKAFLDSGAIGYQAIDTIGEAARKGNGCDCIHAITDMDPIFNRGSYPLARIGDSASRWVVKEFFEREVVINQTKTYPGLNGQLGISDLPIVARTYPD